MHRIRTTILGVASILLIPSLALGNPGQVKQRHQNRSVPLATIAANLGPAFRDRQVRAGRGNGVTSAQSTAGLSVSGIQSDSQLLRHVA